MLLTLSKNLVIEQTENDLPVGDLLFKKKDFSLLMDITNINTLKDKFDIRFQIVRTDDERILRVVGEKIAISKEGRPSSVVTNQASIDEYVAKRDKFKSDIDKAKLQIKDKRTEFKTARKTLSEKRELSNDLKIEIQELYLLSEPTAAQKERITELEGLIDTMKTEINNLETVMKTLNQEMDVLEGTVATKQTKLDKLKEVLPEYEMIDTYDSVIGTHIVNNKLTDSGVTWVKTLPLLKSTVGDYIE